MNQRQHEPPSVDADTAAEPEVDGDQDTVDHRQDIYRQAQAFITPAMQAFAEHWAHSRNQIKAYSHAYPHATLNAARANARHLFADHRIQAEIRRILERWTDHSRVKLERIEHELSRVAFADMRMLFDATSRIKPATEWDADTAAAVASYTEVEIVKGRGAEKYTEITRRVRFHDKHAAARTLLEAKGAFEKHKAPPGVAAIFNISMGGQAMQLGAPIDQGRTITEDVAKPGKLTEARQLPMPAEAKDATRPIAKVKVKALI